jgi:antitoxin component YwqK of YwqJK toxin-antitoxin module
MALANIITLPEYKHVCEHINPVYANIIFSYLTEIRKYYYSTGIISREIPIINIGLGDGKIHGIYKWNYMSGNIEYKTPYINNKEHGIKKEYYVSGKIKVETPYVNGEIHGIKKLYYKSGQIEQETPYINGEVHGLIKEYYKSGQVKKEYFYENGKLIY